MNQKFFSNVQFSAAAHNLDQIPKYDNPEVAFAGCSNVGKSTLINAIVNRKLLCRTSRNPGCTKTINFFEIPKTMYLVDLPGYGYARQSKTLREWWGKTITSYLKGRPNLYRVFVLVDALHNFKKSDYELMKILDQSAVNYQIVFTKLDKISQAEQDKLSKQILEIQPQHPAMYPKPLLISSKNKVGIENIQTEIIEIWRNFSSK